MTCGELISYLKEFGADERVVFLVADLNERIACIIGAYNLVDEAPVIVLETKEYQPLDDLILEAAEEEGIV